MIFEVCKNQQKKTKVRHLGSKRFSSCAALRDRRGPAEALELCKNLKVLFDTLCPPERGRRIEARSAHFARPIMAHGTSGYKKREKGLIKETNNDHVIEHRFRINAKTI